MQGELSEFTLSELLQLFALAERTGTVLVKTPSRSCRVLLESGRIVGIGLEDYDVHRDLMACELLPSRSGAALESIVPAPSTPGLSFIVRNFVEPERWELFTSRCLEQQIYPLLTKESGTFDIAVERVPYCPISINISVQQLVLDGSRWESEVADYRHDGYALTSAWQRTGEHPAECSVSSVEWLTWAILDEPQTIATVASRVCIPDLEAMSAIRRLADRGLLTPDS